MAQPPAPKTYWRCDECASDIPFKISDTQVECVKCHKLWSVQELSPRPTARTPTPRLSD